MSRFGESTLRFASRTTYEALEVDSGEESDGSSESEQNVPIESLPEGPVKLTKSAIKKANRIARLERKLALKEKARKERLAGNGILSGSSANAIVPDVQPPVPAEPVDEEPRADLAPSIVEDVSDQDHVSDTTDLVSEESASEVLDKPTNGFHHAPNADIDTDIDIDTDEKAQAADSIVPEPRNGTLPNGSSARAAATTTPVTEDPERAKKRQNALTRTLWTFIMIGGFISLLLLGHVYMVLLVFLCQTLVYREVTALFSLKTVTPDNSTVAPLKGKDPWSKTLNWYFFAATNYFLYGESIIYYFKHVVFADGNMQPFATNHRIISFTLYTIGFMGFVLSLKKGYLKQQFGLFCWVHMTLMLIVMSSHFIVNNILEGMIWFFVPASLVICNDCFAYIFGVLFGRTPLIKLSPKKTVEGFVGAFISTMLFSLVWGTFFARFDYMICPVQNLGVNAFNATSCTPNPVFVWRAMNLWKPLAILFKTLTSHDIQTFSYTPYQMHCLVLATFASLVAPFGGFFASGFKRAFNIKDFGDSIPGHGGMTDRMDCQFLMGIFTYVYYSSLIRVHQVTVGGVLQTIVSGLTVDQQLQLIRDLTHYLERQGISVS